MISIYNNLPANNVARTLSAHYRSLQTSTQRLSSGLRINGAADDAAGLAIRELMRSDVAALHQGVRNANDGISMLQTFDGALGVIDEKLIRMKELAEQAATGTYDSTQRLMIDSEFQAMASEINRIANATDFNGVKLLCTPMVTKYRDVDEFVINDPGTIVNEIYSGGQQANITKNINAANLIDDDNPARTILVRLTAKNDTETKKGALGQPVVGPSPNDQNMTRNMYKLGDSEFTVAYVDVTGSINNPKITYTNGNWQMSNDGGASTDFNPTKAGDKGIRWTAPYGEASATLDFSMDVNKDGKDQPVDFSTFAADNPKIVGITVDTVNNEYEIKRNIVTFNEVPATAEYTAVYNEANNTVTVNLKNDGGSVDLKLDKSLTDGDTVFFDITLEGETKTVQKPYKVPDPDQKVKIHFGTMNDSAEDYYYINFSNCTTEGLGLDGVHIKTQDNAQEALVQINDAIVVKDKVRANYGAMQNRLENTITNLTTQAENLQAAESRISDADIAQEMMKFVRNQILTQSAVAMLAQANSMPQMVFSLIR